MSYPCVKRAERSLKPLYRTYCGGQTAISPLLWSTAAFRCNCPTAQMGHSVKRQWSVALSPGPADTGDFDSHLISELSKMSSYLQAADRAPRHSESARRACARRSRQLRTRAGNQSYGILRGGLRRRAQRRRIRRHTNSLPRFANSRRFIYIVNSKVGKVPEP